jgi:primosomal protein N' (replication factor Y)
MSAKRSLPRVCPSCEFETGALVAVLTAQPLGGTLDYLAPAGGCDRGDFVEVPLGPRRVLGVVWGAGEGGFDLARAKPVARVLDLAPMDAGMRGFLERAAAYTLTPLPAMLRLATRAPRLMDPPGAHKVYRPGEATPDRMTDARARVLEVLRAHGGMGFGLRDLCDLAGVSASVVKGLVAQGALIEAEAPRDAP